MKNLATADLIGRDHPSYGVDHAWFLFSVTDVAAGRISRLIYVEGKGPWAVQTIERIAYDGRVSPNCELLTVIRECEIGIRSDMVEVVSYVDFMLDVVHPDRLLRDALVTTAFRSSLSQEQIDYASKKLERGRQAILRDADGMTDHVRPLPLRSTRPFDADSDTYQDALAALTDLGYKRAQACKALDALGPEARSMPLEKVLKTVLQNFQTA